MNVKTPRPSLKRRYAPKEMRAQNGSYDVVRYCVGMWLVVYERTYGTTSFWIFSGNEITSMNTAR